MAHRAGFAIGLMLLVTGGALLLFGSSGEPAAPLFFGEMWLPLEVPSRLVLRPDSPETPLLDISPLEVVPLAGQDVMTLFPEEPPRLNKLQHAYESVKLPFSVTLKAVEYETGEITPARLNISDGTGERVVPFEAGESVVIAGQTFAMREIRPWGGILPEPPESGGTPLAVVALRRMDSPWTEDTVAQHGDWLKLDADLVFRFLWVRSEEEALQTFAQGIPGMASARWGVQEQGVMNWFDSFQAGSGLELADGTAVVLSAVRGAESTGGPESPALCFKVVREGAVEDVWVAANSTSEDGLLHFSYPALAPWVLLACAWETGAMRFQLYRHGEEAGGGVLRAGDIATLDSTPYAFRLDQALDSAVYLRREDSPLQEAALEGPGRILRFRQGEAVILPGCAVEFQPLSKEIGPVYSLEIEESGATRTLVLHRDTVASAGGWTVQQAAGAGLPEDWATLYLELPRSPAARQWGMYALGAAGAILAAAALAQVMGRRRPA